MKTEVVKGKEENKSKYPYLGIYEADGDIVLFASQDAGVVVHSPSGDFEEGYYSETWDEADFKVYTGKVILTND